MNRYHLSIFSALMVSYAGTALADDGLKPVVVTASRVAEDAGRVSADVTVIDQNQIEKSQAQSVAELLRHQAGIDVVATGGPGKNTSVFIRGANSGHTLVLIDGVRMGAATTGSFDWSDLSTADIERIEIVRGPQSSLYGADAMGGVIQIFTKKGTGPAKVRVTAEAGSYGTARGSMQVSGANRQGVRYSLTGAGQRTRGVSVAANGTEPDGFRSSTVSGNLSLPLGEGELQLVARNSDGKTGLDGGFPFGDVLNYNSQTKQSLFSGKLTYPVTDLWESSLQLARSGDEVVSRDPAVGVNNTDITTRMDQLRWQNSVEWQQLSLLAGVDLRYTSGRVVGTTSYDKKISQKAGFASVAWHHALFDANAAVRRDQNSNTSDKTTWRLGLSLLPVKGLKLSGNYGTGFKAPSFNDLYWPGAGNLNLRPESSRGWDIGLHYQGEVEAWKGGLGATWFQQTFQNLIAWAPLGAIGPFGPAWIPSNVNQAGIKGLELEGELEYGVAYLRANWTWLDARDTLNNTLLQRRARDSGNILIGADVAGLNIEANVKIVGPRFSGAGNTLPMAGYHKLDVRTSYAVNEQWKLTARVENAENRHYEEVSGYGVLGRAWYAGVNGSF